MEQALELDDNLSRGVTYTFTFDLDNLFSMPSIATLLNDIRQQAPSFVGSVGASWSSGVGLLTNYLNVTFSYSGDGSDVVSDVADELIQVFSDGSSDNFSFVQATGGTAGVTSTTAITKAVSQVGSTVGQGVGAAIQSSTSSVFSNLGVSGWIVVGLVVLGVLAYFSAVTGIRAPRTA